MDKKEEGRQLIVSYLLGELSEAARARFERDYFADDGLFQQLRLTEDELIDAYVRDELSASAKRSFETNFLASPGQRERVATARALLQTLAAVQPKATAVVVPLPRKNFVIRFAIAAGIMALLLGGGKMALDIVRLRGALADAEAAQASLRNQQQALADQLREERKNDQMLAGALAQLEADQHKANLPDNKIEKPAAPPPVVASFVLMPQLQRGNDNQKRLVMPAAASAIELQLSVPGNGNYQQYQVKIKTPEGDEIWSKTGLSAKTAGKAKIVEARLAALLVRGGDYIVTVSGINAQGSTDDLNDYYFRMLRK